MSPTFISMVMALNTVAIVLCCVMIIREEGKWFWLFCLLINIVCLLTVRPL